MSVPSINTLCVQGGYTPGNGEPRQIPLSRARPFKYDTADGMGKLFDLEAKAIFTPACRTRPATVWRPRSRRWRAARPVC